MEPRHRARSIDDPIQPTTLVNPKSKQATILYEDDWLIAEMGLQCESTRKNLFSSPRIQSFIRQLNSMPFLLSDRSLFPSPFGFENLA